MAEFKLEKGAPFAGCELPLTLGSARLEMVDITAITAVMPLKGQAMAVVKAIKTALAAPLPMVGEVVQAKAAELVWFGPGQWLVFYQNPKPVTDALQGLAAVVDQSGGWLVLELSGTDAAQVMARLCSLDIERLAVGRVARTEFCHVSAMIIPREKGYQIAVPRSFAISVYEHTAIAMRSVAAQALLDN